MPTRRTFDKAEFLPNDNSKPHIVPDVLYPAISGKLLDGTTSHSGDYGTAQSSDSRKYYYTDIKGSKPIRDPRIGAHFGSQRHKFKSIQLLEQETATHGSDIYSVDGREWMRFGSTNPSYKNDLHGVSLHFGANVSGDFVEITGYFNALNIIVRTEASRGAITPRLNGTDQTAVDVYESAVTSPLGSRYVDAGSVVNVTFSSSISLGINTVKLTHGSTAGAETYGIELIAQDTTNAVTRNKIQIPSQTVFSFGSKFTVGGSSAAKHYDPFSAKSDGTGWTSPTSGTNTPNSSAAWPSNIDTATSLGLANWVDGTNYYRPYNGARVVNWVDENGEIKTSVNVMPPNAKSIANSGTLTNGAAKTNGSAPNDNFRPTFETHTADVGVDEDLLSEVAKTYRFREFGNGSANAGSNAGSYKDFSMLSGTSGQENAYVMDDGLTSLAGKTIEINSNGLGDNLGIKNADGYIYFTFIGTGLTISDYNGNPRTFAQNLPYGTHIVFQDHDGSNVDWFMDGVQLLEGDGGDTGITVRDITYHQPKMPPIPEGACIIADYMLMADFVIQSTTVTLSDISKGVRMVSASRDFLTDSSSALASGVSVHVQQPMGLTGFSSGTAVANASLPFFGTRFLISMEASNVAHELTINGSSVTETVHDCSADNDGDLKGIPDASVASLGLNTASVGILNGSYRWHFGLFDSPIHTSHHYKSFETPFLHELIGGDRNMEQTHLICSADGKTWDEVTRDKKYLGPRVALVTQADTSGTHGSEMVIFTQHRGGATTGHATNKIAKGIVYGYDRVIILEEGLYDIEFQTYSGATDVDVFLKINDSTTGGSRGSGQLVQLRIDPANETAQTRCRVQCKRGDFFCVATNTSISKSSTFLEFQKIE